MKFPHTPFPSKFLQYVAIVFFEIGKDSPDYSSYPQTQKEQKSRPQLFQTIRGELSPADFTLMALPMSAAGTGALFSGLHGSWTTPFNGDGRAALCRVFSFPARSSKNLRPTTMMKNVNEGKGIFAPVIVLTRNIVGAKRFNQLRGKAIALHSQVITEFCKTIGADGKQRQGLIRLAKKNGEKLGFLA